MNSWLIVNMSLGALEGIAYAATAVAVWRAGGFSRRLFALWWATSAIGMLSALRLMGSRWLGGDTVAAVKLNISFTLFISILGVMLLVPFLWFLWRGTNRGWIAAPFLGLTAVVAILAVWMAPATVEHASYGTVLKYTEGAPPGLFVQGAASLLPAVIAVAMLFIKGDVNALFLRRLRLVSAAVLIFYVSKAIAGAVLSTDFSAVALIFTRLAGMAAALIGSLVYLRHGTLDAATRASSKAGRK